MLARTKLLTFCLCFLIIFSILVTVFSENGYIVNRELRRYSESLSSEIERKKAELEMLKADGGSVLDGGILSDSRGGIILIDGSEKDGDAEEKGEGDGMKNGFTPLSMPMILILSITFSAAITAALNIIAGRMHYGKSDNRKE